MKFFLLFLGLMIFSASAFAGCYSMKEAEAEQGIRIHSELMVIGLNCQHLWPKSDKNLYAQYKDFTANHAGLLRGYETTLINYFRKEGGGDPELRLHELRTRFANKISKDAAVMRPDGFCRAYAPRVPKANKMAEPEVRKWAATIFPNFPPSRPLCAN